MLSGGFSLVADDVKPDSGMTQAQKRLIESASKELSNLNKNILDKIGGLEKLEGRTVILKAKVTENPDGIRVEMIDASLDDGKTVKGLPDTVFLKGAVRKTSPESFSLDMKDIYSDKKDRNEN